MHAHTHCRSHKGSFLSRTTQPHAITYPRTRSTTHPRNHTSNHPRAHVPTLPSTHPRIQAPTHSWSHFTCNLMTTHPYMHMHTSGAHDTSIDHVHSHVNGNTEHLLTYPILHQWPHTLRTYTPCTPVQTRTPSGVEPLKKTIHICTSIHPKLKSAYPIALFPSFIDLIDLSIHPTTH